MPEFYTILARKVNKMPEFYIIFARKIFFPNFGGTRAPLPPSPAPMGRGRGATALKMPINTF